MMGKRIEGPVQVLTPRGIPISQRELYRKTSGLGVAVAPAAVWPGPQHPDTGLKSVVADAGAVGLLTSGSSLQLPGNKGALSIAVSRGVGSLSVAPASLISASPSRHQRQNLRRIFVQTDSGAVVSVEVDCAAGAGGAEKVKRSVQAALNVPTEQADLIFGGQVLEDLNGLQNDVPVLLRRGITRSASSPNLATSAPVMGFTSMSDNGALSSTFKTLSPVVEKEPVEEMFEVVGGVKPCSMLKQLMQEAAEGVALGVEPVPATGGTGGAYYFRNAAGREVVIVKPTDEEPFAPNNPNGYVGRALGQPGLKQAIRVGEAGLREVAAYLLDHNSFAGVPYTALVKASHPSFNVNASAASVSAVGRSCSVPAKSHSQVKSSAGLTQGMGLLSMAGLSSARGGGSQSVKGGRVNRVSSKLCSLQQYVQHDYDTSECGTSRFPVSAVHRIGILDVRIFNTDRHSGNILVRRLGEDMFERRHVNPVRRVDEAVQLIPIDHGFSLPETLEAAYFEWLHWPQASLPFSEQELQYISTLDVHSEVLMLRECLPMMREGCLRVLILSTTLLQRGAVAGLTLADIGAIMSREVRGTEEVASELECLCLQAMQMVTIPPLSESSDPGVEAGGGNGWRVPEVESNCSTPKAGFSASGRGGSSREGMSDSPGLFFDFDEEGEDGELEESKDNVPVQDPVGCLSPKGWVGGRLEFGRGTRESKAAVRLDFSAPKAPVFSELEWALAHHSGKNGVNSGVPPSFTLLTGKGSVSMKDQGVQTLPLRRQEGLLLKRFRQAVIPQAPSLPQPSAGSGLKVGSAGVLGRRLKAAAGQSAADNIDGLLPGGGKLVLSDMEEAVWEQFYEVYLDLVEGLVVRKVAERGGGGDIFGMSCQW